MKLYKGTAPCPGCGRTGEEVARSSKESLCYDCIDTLKIGRTIVKERNLDRKRFLMDDLTTGFMTWYQIRDKDIDKSLRELLWTFSQFDSRYAVGYCRQDSMLAGYAGGGTSHDCFVLPKVTFEAARKLCHAIKDAVDELNRERDNYKDELDKKLNEERNRIYNDGVAHGRNLLMQLNRGEISVNDFEKPVKKF